MRPRGFHWILASPGAKEHLRTSPERCFSHPPLFSTNCLNRNPACNDAHRAFTLGPHGDPGFCLVAVRLGYLSQRPWVPLASRGDCRGSSGRAIWHGVSTSGTPIPGCILASGSVTEDWSPLFPPFVTPAPLDYSTVRPLFSLLCGPGNFRHLPGCLWQQ